MGEWQLVQLGCRLRSNSEDGGEWIAMARLGFTASVHPRPKEPVNDITKMMSCRLIFHHEGKISVVFSSLLLCHSYANIQAKDLIKTTWLCVIKCITLIGMSSWQLYNILSYIHSKQCMKLGSY